MRDCALPTSRTCLSRARISRNPKFRGSVVIHRSRSWGSLLRPAARWGSRDEIHLVTVIGPGGVGKTRLALQAAADALDQFADGIYWVPLAPIQDPELALDAIAQALGLRREIAEPIDATVARYLSDKKLLLVIDNFEHLLGAAPALAKLLTAGARRAAARSERCQPRCCPPARTCCPPNALGQQKDRSHRPPRCRGRRRRPGPRAAVGRRCARRRSGAAPGWSRRHGRCAQQPARARNLRPIEARECGVPDRERRLSAAGRSAASERSRRRSTIAATQVRGRTGRPRLALSRVAGSLSVEATMLSAQLTNVRERLRNYATDPIPPFGPGRVALAKRPSRFRCPSDSV
jgi:hypothetical protein